MEDFTVRVELIRANSEDYTKLHEKMDAYGYRKHIVGRDGTKYDLPTAEYITTSALGLQQIREQVSAIAESVRPTAYEFVTQSAGWAWYLHYD